MVFDPNWAPFEYYSAEQNTVAGINSEIINLLMEKSGLEFDFVLTESYEKAIEMVCNSEVDFLMSFDDDEFTARDLGMSLTDVFMSSPFVLVGLDTAITDEKTIALPSVYIVAQRYAKTLLPNNKIVIYEDIEACYDAIMTGEADYTFENVHVARDVIKSDKYKDLSIIYVTAVMDSFTIAARSDIDPIVIDILNKTIASIKKEEIENIIYTNSITPEDNITFKNFFIKYKVEVMLTALIVFLLALFACAYIIIIIRKSKHVLWKMAYIDKLTGISNLDKFKIDVQILLPKIDKTKYELVRFDVEKFKIINDMFGFDEGDRVLLNVVKAIEENLQPDELYARVTNDIFVMLVKYNEDSLEIKNTLLSSFLKFHETDEIMYKIDFTTGIYLLKADDDDISTMLDRAIMAHKSAKLMEPGSTLFFNDDIRDTAIRIKEIENTMAEALANGDFVVYIQPKFHLDTLKIGGAESLIRWKSITGGVISPNEFIPIFEKNGFVVNIDNFVLEETCKYQKMLLEKGITPVPISVNQSRLHIKNPNYVDNIKAIINKYQIPPSLIELELTETTMHDNIDILIDITRELCKFGLIMSIDDFGSGYSSLNLLKDISANVLKIDREFLVHSEENDRGKTVLANIIRLAKELNMQIVTEGVETEEQAALLKELGSDMVQGYLFARPMPLAEFEKFL